jgi:hypothetical protein
MDCGVLSMMQTGSPRRPCEYDDKGVSPDRDACAADRPLGDLEGFSTTNARNIHDLPLTSPHGRHSEHDTRSTWWP